MVLISRGNAVGCIWHTHTHTRPFTGPLSWTNRMGRYQKGKTNLDFTEARDSEWQRHQQGHMQVCTSLQTDNHDSTLPLSFLQAGCPSRRPTNSIKALKHYMCWIKIIRRICVSILKPQFTRVLTVTNARSVYIRPSQHVSVQSGWSEGRSRKPADRDPPSLWTQRSESGTCNVSSKL